MAQLAVLTPESAHFPSSNFPEFRHLNRRFVLAYDASTDETAYWSLVARQGITTPLTLVVFYAMASATSGSVRWQAAIEAITPGDSLDLNSATSFDTANSAGGTVPGTASYLGSISVTLTNNDSIAAGDYVRISLTRDADGTSGTDDASGDARVLCVELRDAA